MIELLLVAIALTGIAALFTIARADSASAMFGVVLAIGVLVLVAVSVLGAIGLVSRVAQAEEGRFVLSGPAVSYHFNRAYQWNEHNRGAGVAWQTERATWFLAAHENSYRGTPAQRANGNGVSVYAGVRLTALSLLDGRVRLEGVVAGATGYARCPMLRLGDVCAAVAPAITIQPWRAGLGVTIIPMPSADGAILLQTHWSF